MSLRNYIFIGTIFLITLLSSTVDGQAASAPVVIPAATVQSPQAPPAPTTTAVPVKAPTTLPAQSVKKVFCEICHCPKELILNPYIIDCLNQGLTAVPIVDDFLRTNHSGVANVHLEISNNNIRTVGRFADSTAINEINLLNSNVESIEPYAFAGLKNLQRLDLSQNRLTSLSRQTFRGENEDSLQLQELNLGHNSLHSLDNELLKYLPLLTTLRLSGNPLAVLDAATSKALIGCNALHTLDLSYTMLSTLDMELKDLMKSLEFLNLAGNKFAGVPEVMQYAESMTELILDENPLHELDSLSFNGMEKLVRLDVAYTHELSTIYGGTFQTLRDLKVLNINGNVKLTTIEPDSFPTHQQDSSESLDTLDLSNNNLSVLGQEVFVGTNIKKLMIEGNPLECTCHIEWMKISSIVDTSVTDCVLKPNLTHHVIDDVNFETVPCPGQTTIHTSFITMRDTISEIYIFMTVALLLGFFVLIATLVVLFRSKPEWRYSVLRVIRPSRVPYKRSQDNNGFEALPDEPWVEFTRSEY